MGSLSTQDVDSSSFTYTMLDSSGGRFALSGGKVVVADRLLLDFEQQASHTVQVRVQDGAGGSLIRTFTIGLTDISPEAITGDDRANTFFGGSGNDLLDGGAGIDRLVGGAGNDTYTLAAAGDAIVELAGGGIDRVNSAVSVALAANVENLVLTGTAVINGTGNAEANQITGNSVANRLAGERATTACLAVTAVTS